MALTQATSDAFMREVDEGLRRDQVVRFWRRFGRLVIGGIVVGLIVLGGVLYWHHHKLQVAGGEGEKLSVALDHLTRNQPNAAVPDLQELGGSSHDGYRALSKLALAAVALQKEDVKGSATAFAAIAGDTGIAQPFRDAALLRQTTIEFDAMAPDAAIARLKPLAVRGNPWFGSAGELTAIAHLRAGRNREAGAMFAAVASDPGVPKTIRSRAVQMANILGVAPAEQPEASLAR